MGIQSKMTWKGSHLVRERRDGLALVLALFDVGVMGLSSISICTTSIGESGKTWKICDLVLPKEDKLIVSLSVESLETVPDRRKMLSELNRDSTG